MSIELPAPISHYFGADRDRNAETVARCFTDDAVVRDEGHIYNGIDAIRRWKKASSTKYSYTTTPISIATDGDRIVVTCHLEGDFPGSPVDLRYFFRLNDDKVTQLEIML